MSDLTKEDLKKKLRAHANGTLVSNVLACLLTSACFLLIPFGVKTLPKFLRREWPSEG